MKSPLDAFQPLGRALMLPIAVLPAAGLLLRLGQADLLNLPFLAAAGDAVFANLGLLFAAGVAVGLAREGAGAAGLAGVVGFLIATRGAQSLIAVPAAAHLGVPAALTDIVDAAFREKAVAKLSVPIGILCGVVGGAFYNRFSTIKLPEYLAFFGGRRFVPIITGAAGVAIAAAVGLGYAGIAAGMDALSHAILGSGEAGLFAFGLFNRLLIVTGLHHILNNLAWFVVGDYHGATGDLRRFFAGDPTAGDFMAGFFPVIMFGLPAACFAMYRSARPERRKAVGGMLSSLALTAFLTGVTEPIEFSFMFLAPALFVVHAVLTGLAMALMHALGVKLGFGFSAGLFDYVLNYGRATRPLWLLPVGAVYALAYYAIFRFAIVRFDLKTPGREPAEAQVQAAPAGPRGVAYAAALGGSANLVSVDACTTRLRLVVVDPAAIDEAALKGLGARGVLRLSGGGLQVVIGPSADSVAAEVRDALAAPGGVAALPARTAPAAASAAAPTTPPAGPSSDVARGRRLLAALGGAGNVLDVAVCDTRLVLRLKDAAAPDEPALQALGGRGLARTAAATHLLLGPRAALDAQSLREALAD